MPTRDDIHAQMDLLRTHRRTLAILLKQQAGTTSLHSKPETQHGITEARDEIGRIKLTLREWKVPVDDMPNDEAGLTITQIRIIKYIFPAAIVVLVFLWFSGWIPDRIEEAGWITPIEITVAYSDEKEEWFLNQVDIFNDQRNRVNFFRRIEANGIKISSGDAANIILNGKQNFVAWTPASSTWLEIIKAKDKGNLGTIELLGPLAWTPVVIAMWEPIAQSFGLSENQNLVSWEDLLKWTNTGWQDGSSNRMRTFSWGYTDPQRSTTGLSTLIAMTYAANQKSNNLTLADINGPQSQKLIRDLNTAIKYYGRNTIDFSSSMQEYGIDSISAVAMEEVTVRQFNRGVRSYNLVALYPQQGTFWHNNPLIILPNASTDQAKALRQLYTYLLSERSQKDAEDFGFHRAKSDDIAGPPEADNALPRPTVDIIVTLQESWPKYRRQANIMLLVDISGSMNNDDKIISAKRGIREFINQISNDDYVGLTIFSDDVKVLISPTNLGEIRSKIEQEVDNLPTYGNTLLYDAIKIAKIEMDKIMKTRSGICAIVLLSDGIHNDPNHIGTTNFEDLEDIFTQESNRCTIFPIAYSGNPNNQEERFDPNLLRTIGKLTGRAVSEGNVFTIIETFRELSYTISPPPMQ